jgi:hypothetical protein
MTDEQSLLEKIRKLEALFAGAASDGERNAALNGLERVRERLERIRAADPPVEYRFSMSDQFSRMMFIALLRRYGISPYRYSRQRHTTVMAHVPKTFVNDVLWPEFVQLDDALKNILHDTTERLISAAVFKDASDAEVRPESAMRNLTGE